MRIPRFFLDTDAIDAKSGTVAIDDISQIRQIVGVLRLGRGDKIDVLDGKGVVYRVCLNQLGKKVVTGIIEEQHRQNPSSPLTLCVALPLLKGDRFDWAVEKLTELGVSQVVPLICHRTVVKPADNDRAFEQSSKFKRWRAIAREAAEQSERATIPHIVPPTLLADLFKCSFVNGAFDTTLFLQERSHAPTLTALLSAQSDQLGSSILVITGPEGGFTEHEIDDATNQGVTAVSLGEQILRSETAAICASALIISFLTKHD